MNEQDVEKLVDALAEECKDGGLFRTLIRLKTNQRLSGPDYRRLTLACTLALAKVAEKAAAVSELES